MTANFSSQSLAPTSSTERIADIDILRGFALFGIMVVNIFYFGVPNVYYSSYFGTFSGIWNTIIFHGVNFLFTAKFYPIFSFLFGYGFFIQYSKSTKKGIDTRSFFIRRLTILLLFGILHIFFIWEEDILSFYALFGLTLILLGNRPPKVILISAIVAYILFVFVDILIATHLVSQNYNPFDSLAAYTSFYRTASFWQIMWVRLNLYFEKLFTLPRLIHHFDRLAFFMVGLYAGKKNLIADIYARRNAWMRLWLAVSIVGIFLQMIWFRYESLETVLLISLSRIFTNLFLLAQVLTYIIGFLLLINTNGLKKRFEVLASPGRMALTNYLMHTTVFSLLFYSYGLGLYAKLGPVELMAITITLFTFQVIFSNIWLNYCNYGPLEWIWRSFTYKKLLPLIKSRAVVS
jgi:uncharacterized protein